MPILDRIDHLHRARTVKGDLPFHSVYTVGIAGERFFRALKDEGKIMGTRCGNCEVSYIPGRMYCERCFTHLEDEAWFDAGTWGNVHTFTVMHIGLDGDALETPQVLAFIEIGETGSGLVHNLGDVDPDELFIGMPVEAVFKSAGERTGSITDIRYFKPAE
jgi:uncharacterized OB-fold protein